MKYHCKICGSIVEQVEENHCPICYADASFLEECMDIEEQHQVFQKAVQIGENNLGIERDNSKCIDCGQCKVTCMNRTGLDFGSDTEKCLSCGQCILTCPTGALKVKKEIPTGRTMFHKFQLVCASLFTVSSTKSKYLK